jgi:hypothetical protein
MRYSKKTVNNLTPEWYRNLSKKERNELNRNNDIEKKGMLLNKPKGVSNGQSIKCIKASNTTSVGRKYIVRNYFATLVTTIYGSTWNEFVIIKNDYGYTVKINLKKFEKP